MPSRTDVRVALLGRCPLFEGLPIEARRDLLRIAAEKKVKRAGTYFEEGNRPCSLHLLVSGGVKLTQSSAEGQEVIVRLIGPGQAFAWTAALEGSAYPATATAVRESLALLWSPAQVSEILARHPQVGRNAIRILLMRVRELEDRLREMATERVAQRIARTLLRLVQHAGRKVEGGVLIDLPLSREEIARMSGTTLFTVSRTLQDWEQRGIVRVGRREVLVLQPHGLVSIAENLNGET